MNRQANRLRGRRQRSTELAEDAFCGAAAMSSARLSITVIPLLWSPFTSRQRRDDHAPSPPIDPLARCA